MCEILGTNNGLQLMMMTTKKYTTAKQTTNKYYIKETQVTCHNMLYMSFVKQGDISNTTKYQYNQWTDKETVSQATNKPQFIAITWHKLHLTLNEVRKIIKKHTQTMGKKSYKLTTI